LRANLDTILSAPDAAMWFTRLRGTPVTRHTIYGWAARYPDLLPKRAGGYRYGDLLRAEARARNATRETRRVA
jgi:hypothetical protein